MRTDPCPGVGGCFSAMNREMGMILIEEFRDSCMRLVLGPSLIVIRRCVHRPLLETVSRVVASPRRVAAIRGGLWSLRQMERIDLTTPARTEGKRG